MAVTEHMTPDDAAQLAVNDLQAVCALLGAARTADWTVVKAAIRVLALTSYGPAAIELNWFVRGHRHVAPGALIEAAEAAEEAIVARQQQAQQNRQLLRSASPVDADPNTLLRRASDEAEPSEQLLRRTDAGDGTEVQ